jgi:hypothetical protein
MSGTQLHCCTGLHIVFARDAAAPKIHSMAPAAGEFFGAILPVANLLLPDFTRHTIIHF